MANSFTPGSPAAVAFLNQLLASRGVDVQAADRVFGPGQFNDAGGVWTGRYKGMSPQQKNALAWSTAGLTELADRVAGVARGQHGAQAVNSIVRRFERPADPNGEVSRALGGQVSTFGGGAASAPSTEAPAAGARQQFASALLQAMSPTGQLENPSALVQALQARRSAAPMPSTQAAPTGPTRHGGIAELLQEGTGGPTHSTGPHIHAAFTDPQLELAAIQWAQQHGLHVGENPYVGSLDAGVHAPNSFHKRVFPGLFNGRKLGEAIDVSGGNTGPFYKWLQGQR